MNSNNNMNGYTYDINYKMNDIMENINKINKTYDNDKNKYYKHKSENVNVMKNIEEESKKLTQKMRKEYDVNENKIVNYDLFNTHLHKVKDRSVSMHSYSNNENKEISDVGNNENKEIKHNFDKNKILKVDNVNDVLNNID